MLFNHLMLTQIKPPKQVFVMQHDMFELQKEYHKKVFLLNLKKN